MPTCNLVAIWIHVFFHKAVQIIQILCGRMFRLPIKTVKLQTSLFWQEKGVLLQYYTGWTCWSLETAIEKNKRFGVGSWQDEYFFNRTAFQPTDLERWWLPSRNVDLNPANSSPIYLSWLRPQSLPQDEEEAQWLTFWQRHFDSWPTLTPWNN